MEYWQQIVASQFFKSSPSKRFPIYEALNPFNKYLNSKNPSFTKSNSFRKLTVSIDSFTPICMNEMNGIQTQVV